MEAPTEDEYFFDPEKRIPTLKYLFDEGFIGFEIEIENENNIALVTYDLTNLRIDSSFDESSKTIYFKLANDTLEIKVTVSRIEPDDDLEDSDEEE